MVAAAKAAIPVIGDLAAALQLENFAKATTSALVKLRQLLQGQLTLVVIWKLIVPLK